MSWYLRVQLFVTLAYFAYRAMARFGGQANPRVLVRWGQILLLAALLLPTIARFLPPLIPVEVQETVSGPLAEWEGTATPAQSIALPHPDAIAPPADEPAPAPRFSYKQLVFILLSLDIAASLLRLAWRFCQLRALLARASRLKSHRRVELVVSDEIAVPFSARLRGKAWVVIPADLLARWSDAKLAIRHELQHHRQHDTQWAIAIEWLVALLFPNPLARSWRAAIQEAQELSCDRALIGRRIGRHEYASCLVRVAETALRNRRALVGTASMATASRDPIYSTSFLKRRIEMLSQLTTPRRPWTALIGTAALGGLISLAGIAAVNKTGEIGAGVVATDPGLQKIADETLHAALERYRASLGIVVVSDPQTGRVLAVANEDRVEPKEWDSPHWALSRQIEPGSLSKTLVAAYALAHDRTRPDEIHDCAKGNYRLGDRVYHDWKAFDKLTTSESIQHSSNICGIRIGERVGAAGLAQAMRDFGIGAGGVAEGFAEARAGEYPDPERTEANRFVAIISTGYDAIHLTPLELTQAYGAIANGGNLLKPLAAAGKPEVIRRVMPEKTAEQMKAMLAEVLVHGTANESSSKRYRLAGKTSTGYSRTHYDHDKLGGESNLASFIGFGPVEKPRVVIYVAIENPTDGRGVHGSSHAAPVFKEVAEKALTYLRVPEAKP